MAKKMLIDATHAEETRVVVVDGNRVEEFDFESENKRQIAGNIYLAKVTRVEPSLQAAFVDYGGNRHGFLAFSEIHPDYYQIPVADREALLAEEEALAEAEDAEEEARAERAAAPRSRTRTRRRSKAEATASEDAVTSAEAEPEAEGAAEPEAKAEDEGAPEAKAEAEAAPVPEGMEVIDLGDDGDEGEEGEEGEEGGQAAEHAEAEPAEEGESPEGEIESVAEDDVAEEIRTVRKPRPRKYKIQEVIKVRQIMLVQVVKEERGNKGAALTTYLSLAGRYCVLMPNTARGGGISRKITNAADRKKLKQIAAEIDVPRGAGLIIRTAGAKRTKAEIKRDYEYLQRLWEEIRTLTLKSIAPAKIYEEGDLIKRSIRDLYSREIDEVLVEGERGYRVAKDFMKMIMPSHAKNVKHYTDPQPLFARYQVESYLAGMFNPVVQLKSGGYIVIGITEALVAIDVNSGRSTREGSIEETALKTNLEAAEEVARQLRLRDLAGLIVIDFIDMEERRNNAAVEKRLKDKLKNDRARIQVGRISGFGLLEMSRQRLRPGMLEATTQPCPHCHGTGLVRSDDNLALNILRQIEEEGTRRRSREVLVKAPVSIVNYLVNHKRENIAEIERRFGMAIRLEADPFLISPDFEIEKFKTATRAIAEAPAPVVSGSAALMAAIDEAQDEGEEAQASGAEAESGEEQPKKKRRRRRRRSRSKSKSTEAQEAAGDDAA
ncbi:MAG: ribonuclease E/G, partial [Alphaproteobacteria bacterium]